jgi:hypothetical protein
VDPNTLNIHHNIKNDNILKIIQNKKKIIWGSKTTLRLVRVDQKLIKLDWVLLVDCLSKVWRMCITCCHKT